MPPRHPPALSVESPLKPGNKVFIRTVTMYYTGIIARLDTREVVLAEAAWIPETGRFTGFLRDGTLTEVEPFADAISIPRDSIIDVTLWRHDLPRAQLPAAR